MTGRGSGGGCGVSPTLFCFPFRFVLFLSDVIASIAMMAKARKIAAPTAIAAIIPGLSVGNVDFSATERTLLTDLTALVPVALTFAVLARALFEKPVFVLANVETALGAETIVSEAVAVVIFWPSGRGYCLSLSAGMEETAILQSTTKVVAVAKSSFWPVWQASSSTHFT
jgi:hypothetical protein